MNHRERVLHGEIASEHLVQLFDEPDSRADAVGVFLYQGWRANAPLLVVARPANWALISKRLENLGVDVSAAIGEGRIVVLDAPMTLAAIAVKSLDADLFHEHVATVVERLSALGHLHVYGEMVDILAEQANMDAALELETLWNNLSAKYSFTLLCGYSSANFGDARDAEALHRICRAHTRVESHPADLLGTWLLNNRASLQPEASL